MNVLVVLTTETGLLTFKGKALKILKLLLAHLSFRWAVCLIFIPNAHHLIGAKSAARNRINFEKGT
jgi:hypothetical protein